MTHPGLTALGLSDNESGTYLGNGEWSKTRDAVVLEPVNPADGEVIAKVQASSQADYDTIGERAQAAFKVWRTTPAPRRGEAVRLCADALREHKERKSTGRNDSHECAARMPSSAGKKKRKREEE